MSRLSIRNAVKTQLETGFTNVQYYSDMARVENRTLSFMLGDGKAVEPVSDDRKVWQYQADLVIEGRITGNIDTDLDNATEDAILEVQQLMYQTSAFLDLICEGVADIKINKNRYSDKGDMYFAVIISIQYIE